MYSSVDTNRWQGKYSMHLVKLYSSIGQDNKKIRLETRVFQNRSAIKMNSVNLIWLLLVNELFDKLLVYLCLS